MYRKFVYIVLVTSFLLYIFIILLAYKVDVFGLNSYQKQYFNNGSYERYQNIGIAKHHKASVILTGTSISENFKVSLIDEKTIKIPISGSSAKEQNILMTHAITPETKKIIWDVHYTAYYGSSARMHKTMHFPMYLYDESKLNDLKFYASFDTLKITLKKIFFTQKYFTDNFDILYNWYNRDKVKFNKKHVMTYIKRYKNIISNADYNKEYRYELLKLNFDTNILPIIKENKDIEFDFFFPPYTPYYFLGFKETNTLSDIIRFKEYFIEQCKNFSNVQVYDFSIDYKTIENLNNYKDTHHFSQKISDKIIKDILKKKFLIDGDWQKKNIEEYKKYLIESLENSNDQI